MKGWQLGSPQAFQDEATLHRLIEENPQLLPLAGSPRLTILGSEIQLGTGYADILAVESSGRPTIIEVKLASNPEARRAIVSQVLAYAAFLVVHVEHRAGGGCAPSRCSMSNLATLASIRSTQLVLEAVEANFDHAVDGIERSLPLGAVGSLRIKADDELGENVSISSYGSADVPCCGSPCVDGAVRQRTDRTWQRTPHIL